MDKITYLLYSHDDYKDVLDIHLKQLEKYMSHINPIIAFNNIEYIRKKYNKYNVLEYDDSDVYCERMRKILGKINTKYVLFAHDMNILVNYPSDNVIPTIINFMETNNADQVRLSISGIDDPIFNDEMFHEMKKTNYHIFSVSAGIWKTESLMSMFATFNTHPYRCSECPPIQEFVRRLNNYYITSSKDSGLPGLSYHIPSYYPVWHFTCAGKWFGVNPPGKYPECILDILKENNIDLNIRGTWWV